MCSEKASKRNRYKYLYYSAWSWWAAQCVSVRVKSSRVFLGKYPPLSKKSPAGSRVGTCQCGAKRALLLGLGSVCVCVDFWIGIVDHFCSNFVCESILEQYANVFCFLFFFLSVTGDFYICFCSGCADVKVSMFVSNVWCGCVLLPVQIPILILSIRQICPVLGFFLI